MNIMFWTLVALSVGYTAFTGGWEALSAAMSDTGAQVLSACLGMGGGLMLWCGALQIVQQGGLLSDMSRWMRPLLRRLFPGLPPNDEAMQQISANLAANLLGLGNAATPAGLRAMQAMQRLNPDKDRPSDAMCMFLAINTSSVQLVPTMVITLRGAAGSADPADIVLPTLLATGLSTVLAVLLMKLLLRLPERRPRKGKAEI